VAGSQVQTINLVRLVFVTVNICLTIFCQNNDLHFRTFTFKFSHVAMQQSLKTLSLSLQASALDSGHRPATALSLSTEQPNSNLPSEPDLQQSSIQASSEAPLKFLGETHKVGLPPRDSSQVDVSQGISVVSELTKFVSLPVGQFTSYQLPSARCLRTVCVS
jgi:hypothetical protein